MNISPCSAINWLQKIIFIKCMVNIIIFLWTRLVSQLFPSAFDLPGAAMFYICAGSTDLWEKYIVQTLVLECYWRLLNCVLHLLPQQIYSFSASYVWIECWNSFYKYMYCHIQHNRTKLLAAVAQQDVQKFRLLKINIIFLQPCHPMRCTEVFFMLNFIFIPLL